MQRELTNANEKNANENNQSKRIKGKNSNQNEGKIPAKKWNREKKEVN